MDEPDIKYYLQVYEDSGCKYRTNKIIFIEPYPSFKFKNLVKKLDAILIEATTEEFLNYISTLNYMPDEIEKAKISLNYNGIYRLSDIEKTYVTPYESKLYFGYNCTWQDVADGWIFEIEAFQKAIDKVDSIIIDNNHVHCLSIYGPFFAGKSCLLQSLGYYLQTKNYEILEYRGRQLNIDVLKSYIDKSSSQDFAFIIDNAAHYCIKKTPGLAGGSKKL